MLAPCIVIIPILTALILLFVRSSNKILIRLLAFTVAIGTSVLTAIMIIQFQPGAGVQHTFSVPWIPLLPLQLRDSVPERSIMVTSP